MEFGSFPDFVSELAISVFLIFWGLDVKLWSHRISEMLVGRSVWEVIQVQHAAEERLSPTQDKVSGFAREPC